MAIRRPIGSVVASPVDDITAKVPANSSIIPPLVYCQEVSQTFLPFSEIFFYCSLLFTAHVDERMKNWQTHEVNASFLELCAHD